MAKATFLQTSFLGGRFSPSYQGRADDPRYKSALAECLNALPIETGAWARRPGTRRAALSRSGNPGRLREFHFAQNHPYVMEFTAGHLRLFSGLSLVTDSTQGVLAVSTANPAVVETPGEHGWSTSDQVQFFLDPNVDITADLSALTPLLGRQFSITVLSATSFSLQDNVTGASFNGSGLSVVVGQLSVARILDLPTSYTGTRYQDVRTVQDQDVAFALHGAVLPYQVRSVMDPTDTDFATFVFEASTFLDGPYLDPPTDGTLATPSALTGSITVTLSAGATRFTPITDVGRLIRLFSEPTNWAIGASYTVGNTVKFQDAYYQAMQDSSGVQPDTDPTTWAADPSAAVWTWGKITAVASTTVATVLIKGPDLPYTHVMPTWRLGLYSDTTGYPSGGVYHQDRFWFFGVQGNRIDGCKTNGVNLTTGEVDFAPTSVDGTVADNNGLAIVLKATDINEILWAVSVEQGLVLGTQGGEWLVRATSVDDAISPTSDVATKMSKFGCANVDPIQPPNVAAIFVQRNNRKVIEYPPKPQSSGYSGLHLSATSKDLLVSGVAELAYQRETTPTIWARMVDGSLAGATYRREQPTSTMPADFSGWHRHDLGHSRSVISIQSGPSVDGTLDSLTIMTQDTTTSLCYVELITDLYEDTQDLLDACFLDDAQPPTWAQVVGGNVRLYGYSEWVGQTMTVWAAGLDVGDFVVQAGGYINVPLDAAGSLFTTAYLASLTATQSTFSLHVQVRTTPTPAAITIDHGSITEYVDTLGADDGNSNSHFTPDWDRNVGWFATTGGTARVCKYNLTTAVELAMRTTADIGISLVQTSTGSLAPAKDGSLYLTDSSGGVSHISADLVHLGTAAVNQLDQIAVAESRAGPVIIGDALVADTGGGSPGLRGAGLYIVDGTTMAGANTPTLVTDEYTTGLRIFAGPRYPDGSADVYVVTPALQHVGPSTNSPYPIGIYLAHTDPTGATTIRKLGTLSASQVHADWTYIAGMDGALWDETDGALIIQTNIVVPGNWAIGTAYDLHSVARGSDGHDYQSKVAGVGTNTGNDPTTDSGVHWDDLGLATYSAERRLVKVSADAATVLWSCVMAYTNEGIDARSRVRRGRLATYHTHLGSYGDIDVYNTVAGTHVSTTNVPGVTPSLQAYNDETGHAIFYVDAFDHSAVGAPVGTDFTSHWAMYGPHADTPTNLVIPVLIGFNYHSRGQLLRPLSIADTGAVNGPALGKLRRVNQFSVLLLNTQGVQFGTDFTSMRPALFRSPGGNAYTALQLFSGIYYDPVEDGYDFEGQLAWETTRPYPTTVLAVSGFITTVDK